MKLAALKCKTCGAPVPMSMENVAHCPSCGGTTEIPPQYLELRALHARNEQERQQAAHLLKTLDHPPWLLTKVLARIFDLPLYVYFFVWGIPVFFIGLFSAMALQNELLRHGHPTPDWFVYTLAALVIFVIVFGARLAGIYSNRRSLNRARLLLALMAHPGEKGGAASCRECGAPLAVKDGSDLAHCLYCGTDNVVRVKMRIVRARQSGVQHIGSAIAEVVAADHQQRHIERVTAGKELRRYFFWALGFIVPFAVALWDFGRVKDTDETPSWGIFACVVEAFFLIGAVMASVGRSNDKKYQRSDDANDVPDWVSWVAPIAFWVGLYTLARIW